MFDTNERLKAEWTDKYVVIDSSAPELARFAKATGLVKTVNMNGRCLVEFDQYNNVGWYDIAPSALRVVPKPLPKPAEAKPAKAPAAAKPAAAAEKPATAKKPAAAAAPGRPSTAEILARARAAKVAAAPAEPAPQPEAAAEEPAAPAPPPAAKAAVGKLPTTTAEKIAWCRARDAKG